MKKTLSIALVVLLLLINVPFFALAEDEPLYTAKLRYNAVLYKEPDGEMTSPYLKRLERVDIYELLPDWLKIGQNGKILGYIKRNKLDDYTALPLNPSKTPPYPAIVYQYLGWVKGSAQVLSKPSADSEELTVLGDGTRLAFIGVENGWAKLIFRRQYAYVDSRLLKELLPVNTNDQISNPDAPIACYTSFYKTTTDENNLSRIKNIEVSCQKFSTMTIASGGDFDFNRDLGPYSRGNGYFPAMVLVDGGSTLGYGGGTCQVSSTLYNVVLQLSGLEVLHRRPHGPGGIYYIPHGADAAVGNQTQNFQLKNRYPFPIRIDGTAQDGALTLCIFRVEP